MRVNCCCCSQNPWRLSISYMLVVCGCVLSGFNLSSETFVFPLLMTGENKVVHEIQSKIVPRVLIAASELVQLKCPTA